MVGMGVAGIDGFIYVPHDLCLALGVQPVCHGFLLKLPGAYERKKRDPGGDSFGLQYGD